MKIQESTGGWCEEEGDNLDTLLMDGFRILIQRDTEKNTPNTPYFIYIEKTQKVYRTGKK